MAFYITEQGSILKVDETEFQAEVLIKEPGEEYKWHALKLGRIQETGHVPVEEGVEPPLRARLQVNDLSFPELDKLIFNRHRCFFIQKSKQQISLYPLNKINKNLNKLPTYEKNLAGDELNIFKRRYQRNLVNVLKKIGSPISCESDEDIFNLASNTKLIFQIISRFKIDSKNILKEFTSRLASALGSALGCGTAKEEKKKEFETLDQLIHFAEVQQRRLNHWYVWNGRFKVEAIDQALSTLDILKKEEESVEDLPAAAARTSGLDQALAIHRHGFFYHFAKAKAQEELHNECASLKAGI
jgi:hypothetical protein